MLKSHIIVLVIEFTTPNYTMIEFDAIDLLNLQAISWRKTILSSVLKYWDAYDRGYPSYEAFKKSINKLVSVGLVKIYQEGQYMILSNTLYKKMNLIEQLMYFTFKPAYLFQKVLNKQHRLTQNVNIKLNAEDYKRAIQETCLH